ncbi:hypothetical protein GL325_03530 [Aeromicrobium sp. 636]|uniref:Uncharacterized protein n=1 Tax=Aeromicrobium senzhongii TaxID=2663859 RepID=A0A8I0EU29_9ACTN|nr:MULTISPECIES: hypothetical protein [Aeromicrobium]MBC9225386.1 hypothetical protein [Aeromicrobium senzhongii]MCQ3997496.1 hypothetical protein [Aeromicrobium sp. 636]
MSKVRKGQGDSSRSVLPVVMDGETRCDPSMVADTPVIRESTGPDPGLTCANVVLANIASNSVGLLCEVVAYR